MSKLQVALTGSLAAAGAVGFAVQADMTAELRAEAAALRRENAAIQALEVENLRLGRLAVEVGELRRDDAELSRLEEEAAGLRTRLQQIARVEEARAAARVYELSMLDQTPRPRFQARPSYPFEMRRAGISGEVVVEFIVDSNGDVQRARAVRSSQKEFEAAAVQAVSKWRFLAGRKSGREVATRMQVPIVFSLEGKPGVAAPKPAATGAGTEAVTLQPFVTQTTKP